MVMFVCDEDIYINKIIPAVYKLKIDFCGHEGAILHSRDIRKAQGDFACLADPEKKEEFFNRLNEIMDDNDYHLISVAIDKVKHKNKYTYPENPYDLSLTFALERLLPLLDEKGQTEVCIIAEARGKNEDNALKATFFDISSNGTSYHSAEKFRKIKFNLRFIPKKRNIVGTQLADLAAYPIARYVLDPKRKDLAYDIILKKFYRGPGWVYGLKIFP